MVSALGPCVGPVHIERHQAPVLNFGTRQVQTYLPANLDLGDRGVLEILTCRLSGFHPIFRLPSSLRILTVNLTDTIPSTDASPLIYRSRPGLPNLEQLLLGSNYDDVNLIQRCLECLVGDTEGPYSLKRLGVSSKTRQDDHISILTDTLRAQVLRLQSFTYANYGLGALVLEALAKYCPSRENVTVKCDQVIELHFRGSLRGAPMAQSAEDHP